MQPCGLNEFADKRVEHGGTLIRRSRVLSHNPSPLHCTAVLYFIYNPQRKGRLRSPITKGEIRRLTKGIKVVLYFIQNLQMIKIYDHPYKRVKYSWYDKKR